MIDFDKELKLEEEKRIKNGYKNCVLVIAIDTETDETHILSNSIEITKYVNQDFQFNTMKCFFDHLKKAILQPVDFLFDGKTVYRGSDGALNYLKLHLKKFNLEHPIKIMLLDSEHIKQNEVTFILSKATKTKGL